MCVEVPGDNHLAIVGEEDFHKGRKLGEESWQDRRGARPVDDEDSEWPFGREGAIETEELKSGE